MSHNVSLRGQGRGKGCLLAQKAHGTFAVDKAKRVQSGRILPNGTWYEHSHDASASRAGRRLAFVLLRVAERVKGHDGQTGWSPLNVGEYPLVRVFQGLSPPPRIP